MKQIITSLLVLFAALPFSADATESRAVDCQDVAAYFTRVDQEVGAGMTALIEQPGFRESFEQAGEKSQANDTGFLALSPQERGAVIAFLTVPGDALAQIEDDEVPDVVHDLHDSAVAYWAQIPEMMRAIAEGGPSAAMSVGRGVESAAGDNEMASQNLMKVCPNEVEAYAGQAERLDADTFVDPSSVLDDADPDQAEGLGYTIVFLIAEGDAAGGTPGLSTIRPRLAAA